MSALLAVLGTLAGGLLTGLLQHRTARTGRAAARATQLRRDRLEAVTALAVALADHRRAMWELRDAELTAQPAAHVGELRAESHRTRSGVTDPAVRVQLHVANEAVRRAAQDAITATYAMRDAADLTTLQDQRRTALACGDAFVAAAGTHLN